MQFIGVDWGSSNSRAYLIDETGQIAGTHIQSGGVLQQSKKEMAEYVASVRNLWPDAADKIYACGMIGSSIGWIETPYLPCPAGVTEMGRSGVDTEIGDIRVQIQPGLSCRSPFGDCDVLRGEELLAIGATTINSRFASGRACFCLPGTHSKWLLMDTGRVTSFWTNMTGELFDLLARQSLLREFVSGCAAPDNAFRDGVARSVQGGSIGRIAFHVRSRALLEGFKGSHSTSYLSGLLVGSELGEALKIKKEYLPDEPVCLIGSKELVRLYKYAMETLGCEFIAIESDRAAAAGFAALHKQQPKTDE